jgi:hypothetical protein
VVRGSKARAGGRTAPRSMFEQFALEPIWRAYSVCEGEDVQVNTGTSTRRVQLLAACALPGSSLRHLKHDRAGKGKDTTKQV